MGSVEVEVGSVSGGGSFVEEDGSQGVVWGGSGAGPEPEAMSGSVSESWSVRREVIAAVVSRKLLDGQPGVIHDVPVFVPSLLFDVQILQVVPVRFWR